MGNRLLHRKQYQGTSIPCQARSHAVPCEFPDREYWDSFPVKVIASPGITHMRLEQPVPPRYLLSDWQLCEKLDFEKDLPAREECNATYNVTRNGTFGGVLIYMDASVMHPEAREITSLVANSSWAPVFVLFNSQTAVSTGDRIVLRTVVDTGNLTPSYKFTAMLEK